MKFTLMQMDNISKAYGEKVQAKLDDMAMARGYDSLKTLLMEVNESIG